MRTIVAALIGALLMSGPPAAAQPPLTVVELFTSQGCSSCPPADRLLGELAARNDVLALSFHVDYWNYIGWEDPFSRPAFTARQRDYARLLGLRHVYTPQMVVQGRHNVVGSDRGAVIEAIRTSADGPYVSVEVLPLPDGAVRIDVGPAAAGPAEVFLVAFDREHRTEVARGENGGRTLVDTNVVRELTSLGTWQGDRGESYTVPAPSRADSRVRAVILQSTRDGRILSASRL